MMEYLRQSQLWRIGRCAAAAAGVIVQWYRASLLCGLIETFRRSYANSRTHRVLESFYRRESAATRSLYSRILAWLRRTAERFGTALSPAWRHSAVVSFFRRICAAFRRAAEHSIAGRLILRVGLRRIIIIGFGLYLPIDFVLREVLGLADVLGLWDEAFMLFAAAYVTVRRIRGRVSRTASVTPLDGPFLLFIAAGIFLCCVNSPVFSIGFAGLRAVVQYMLWFFILVRLFEEDGDMWVFFGTMAALGTLMAFVGVVQYVLAVPIPASWVSQTEVGVRTRVFGLTTSPNIMGCFMVLCAPLTAALAYLSKKTWQRVLAWGATGMICFSLLFTFSRGAWIGMAVAVVIFAALCDKRLIALMLCAVPVAFMIPTVANRIAYLFTNDFREASRIGGRAIRWEVGMQLFSENPLFGFGLGRFGGAVAMQNQVIESVDGLEYFYLDNYYLKTLVEMGILGTALFAAVLLAVFLMGCKAVGRNRNERLHYVPAAFLSGLCGTMAHMFTENILEVPYMNAYFWAFAAAIAYMGFLRKRGGGSLHTEAVL